MFGCLFQLMVSLLELLDKLLLWLIIAVIIVFGLDYLGLVPDIHSHDWYRVDTVEISCTESEVTYKCSGYNCKKTKKEKEAASNHKFEYTTLSESTCTEVGLRRKECSVCGFAEDFHTTYHHEYGAYSVTKKPGIFTYGEETAVCKLCKSKGTRLISPTGTTKDTPYVATAEAFYKEVSQASPLSRYGSQYVELTGTITSITKEYLWGTGYCIYKNNGKKVICYFQDPPAENYAVGQTVKIVGQYVRISSGTMEIMECFRISRWPFTKPLKEDSTGSSVTTMKKRLQELGYFTIGSSLSDTYNSITVERVKMFQKANGLQQTGTADAKTLSVLFSNAAKANPNTKVKITKQPANAAAKLGEVVKSTVTATGEKLTYTWYVRNPSAATWGKSSVTGKTYSCRLTEANSGRQVYCIVTDKDGNCVVSITVTLSIR
ncbi:MAG: peptidoglycan-binding protein [Clostridia bacterium]|nr:peptidoglycan-binding protein [Clostridia bacterium]